MIAHLDLDAFFASVEQRDNPKLRDRPVVVGFVTPQGKHCNRGVVSAASYEARVYGICSGMSLWEARKRCADLILVNSNFGKYEEASQKMYQILSEYSPQVEPLSLDEAFISFYDCEDLYKDLSQICQTIKQKIKKEIGITASIGLATNKLVAKVASDFNKPDGLTVVYPSFEKAFLAPLPCTKLYGIGPATAEKLLRFGIRTIGELSKMDKKVLTAIFGKYGEALWHSANGLGETMIHPPEPFKSIGRSTTFPFDSKDRQYLFKNLVYLVEKVATALTVERVEGSCITLTLRDKNFKTWSHQKVLTETISTSEQILRLGKKLLDEAWDQITPLRLLGISISHLKPISYQLLLWEDFPQKKVLQEIIVKIRKEFGFWSILPASILDLNQ